jgi:REP element-mobilizing transposase RayT
MINRTERLEPDKTYHLYGRANGSERVFRNEGNYIYFLERYQHYFTPVAETLCYCLMPNHYHFIIRIKPLDELKMVFQEKLGIRREPVDEYNKIVELMSQQLGNFLNSYAKAFNKQQKRKGSLFIRPASRILVDNWNYLRNLVVYIHKNPVEARLANSPDGWKYSSFIEIVNDAGTLVNKKNVLHSFGGLENFMEIHKTSESVFAFLD